MVVVEILLDHVEAGDRRETLTAREPELGCLGSSRKYAGVVIGIHATRVVRVVGYLVDVTNEISAGVDGFQHRDAAGESPRRVCELILVDGWAEVLC